MVLVDTSVWIHFFRNDNPSIVSEFTRLLKSDEVVICPTIIQEILQGIQTDKQFDHVRDLLLSLDCTNNNLVDAVIGSATLYRNLRKSGRTIRKSNDCLIAWYCIEHGIPIFANDRDFEMMVKVSKLRTHKLIKD
ncbi:MAG: putative nucleic acid-binding protein [Cyclobacteriaceae bacterium]